MLVLKDKTFLKELFKLAFPIALGNLVSFSISLSDNMIISKLGEHAASAVFLGNQVALLLSMLTVGIESAALVVISRFVGGKENGSARTAALLAVVFASALSLVFFVFSCFFPRIVLSLLTDDFSLVEAGIPFLKTLGVSFLFFAPSQAMASVLRSIKKAKLAFFAAFSAFLVNLFFNFVLIFGKIGFSRLDILGAGIATLIARVTEFLILFVCVFFVDKRLALRFSAFLNLKKEAAFVFLRNLAPLTATQLVWSVNSFFATSLMGHTGKEVVAGLSVALSLYNLSYVVTAGISGALGIIAGRFVGSAGCEIKNKISTYSKTAEIIALFLGVLTAVFMQSLKTAFISLWGLEGAASEWARNFIKVLSVLVIGTAYQSVLLNGIVRSTGNVGFILKLETFCVFCLIIPMAVFASIFGASPVMLFAILKCDQVFKCPVAYFKIKKALLKPDLTSQKRSFRGRSHSTKFR